MVVGLYILVITLIVNGLKHQPKDRLAGQMKTCACMHFYLPHHSTSPPKLYAIILYY